MNKHEAIENINGLWSFAFEDGPFEVDLINKRQAIGIISQIDEPQKPKVPQVVADWYEEYKDYFEYNLHSLCVDSHEQKLQGELYAWLNKLRNKPIETLVKMKLFGYEVEKEKLYIAKNKQTGEYLCYCFEFFHDKNSSSENQRFTAEEKRWKELGYWGNDLYVFEEAEGGDE